MKISLVGDEISADAETAVELGVEWGVRAFELRGFGGERVPLLSEFKKARLGELVEEYGLQIVAISPGLFKCPYPTGRRERFPLRTFDTALYGRWRAGQDLVKYHREELLPASIEYARQIGAGLVVVFGFDRVGQPAGPAPDGVLLALQAAAQQAAAAGLQLAVEVEDGFWADTGERTAALLGAVGHPALGANWDPGNAYVAGDDPYPAGYRALRDHVRHVHFKDVARRPDGTLAYVVEGDVDWAGQIAALAADGYQGYISVETHMAPKVKSARAALERLRALIGQASEDDSQ
jgi:sugar phosphate isomerase/epimerase